MKVFTLTLVAVLLVSTASAAKISRGKKRFAPAEDVKPSEDDVKAEITEANTDKKEKEVHKRGIFHYGGSSLAAPSNVWPKTYAGHYGYNWPAASGFSVAPLATAGHIHAPAVLKYNTGFHYKTLAAPTVLSSGVSSLSAALPTYASLAPAVSHFHQHSTAQPFVIRPGGAVVQSYSVTYPHHKAAVAVKPVHAFASAAPVHPVHSVTSVQAVHPVQSVHPVQPVHHTFQTLTPAAAVQPVQPVATVQPIQPVAAVQPVHHLHPVQPVQSVVQVQHFKPPVHIDVTQEFPSYFQTSFVQPAPVPALPQRPAIAFTPAQPAFPAIPTFPNPPAFPNVPAVPVSPTPSIPVVPATPTIPTIPSIPNFPQPQIPTNSFFPVNVQPPLQQQPPSFGNVNPTAQFPGFGPIPGNRPDSGSADAAPQIPVQSSPTPEPELPAPQPEPTQTPWRPVLYQPPTAESPVNQPTNTLLPPYGNSPAEGK